MSQALFDGENEGWQLDSNAAQNVLIQGIGPVGALVGGPLADIIGIRHTLIVAVSGFVLALPFLIFSPIPRLFALPEDEIKFDSGV